MIEWARRLLADMAFSAFIQRRCPPRDLRLVRRRSDMTLWAVWHPQSVRYAMRGLFSKHPRARWHFIRVREWRGFYLASPKVFWLPADRSEFHIFSLNPSEVLLSRPLPSAIECNRIDAIIKEPLPALDPVDIGRRIRIVPVTEEDVS